MPPFSPSALPAFSDAEGVKIACCPRARASVHLRCTCDMMLPPGSCPHLQEEAAKHADAITAFQSLRNDVADIRVPNEGAKETLLRCVTGVEATASILLLVLWMQVVNRKVRLELAGNHDLLTPCCSLLPPSAGTMLRLRMPRPSSPSLRQG